MHFFGKTVNRVRSGVVVAKWQVEWERGGPASPDVEAEDGARIVILGRDGMYGRFRNRDISQAEIFSP